MSASGEQGDPTWTAWGRIGTARFDAKKKPVALFGDVLTTVVGADVEQDRWLGGIAVSVSDGAGVFELAGDDLAGEASGRLTNVYGYTRFQETGKIDVWGIFGYGAGELKILQEDEPALVADLGMRMVATGCAENCLHRTGDSALPLQSRPMRCWCKPNPPPSAIS